MLILVDFFLKTKYKTNKSDLKKKTSGADKKISDASGLVKKTDYYAKITEEAGEIPSISGSVTKSASTAVENKITDISNLVKKTDYNKKYSGIEKKLHIIIIINISLLPI